MAKTIENGDYKITYRLPSITEGMRLLGGSGIDPTNPDIVLRNDGDESIDELAQHLLKLI